MACTCSSEVLFRAGSIATGAALLVLGIIQLALGFAGWRIYHFVFFLVGALIAGSGCIPSLRRASVTATVYTVASLVYLGNLFGWMILVTMDYDQNNDNETSYMDLVLYLIAAFCMAILAYATHKANQPTTAAMLHYGREKRHPCCQGLFNVLAGFTGVWCFMMFVPTLNGTGPPGWEDDIVTAVCLCGAAILAWSLLFKDWALTVWCSVLLLLWCLILAMFAIFTGVDLGIKGPSMFVYFKGNPDSDPVFYNYTLAAIPLFACFACKFCLLKSRKAAIDVRFSGAAEERSGQYHATDKGGSDADREADGDTHTGSGNGEPCDP
ncbi:unnamed protein product [Vitrella brassicaformis CCMP3155]|uniref:Uncharacterized protein n=1 Tax=Vitrella brassicaformis (strain CCMP3155) TaxID=1169540 RepID=A0A0G4EK58_VITBC|nr:unnamed protein product [Vitrella brassicaformis CCMP3155]|mmetsp:Transcript_50939/g.127751  ORF Transcript_50939/g.127751 Transcript_50939/m.127751 type:complete len:324 (-) Transcript_50939:760-1731(-)|eukprot:CEL97825.1 unnamed protein product [Vitrella brassicaformis CCMP3155]